MTVVVTGSTGHIGGNLVRALLADGRRVRAVVHDRSAALEGVDVERVVADVRDPNSLEGLFSAGDTVFHLAALISIRGSQRGRVEAVNVEGVRNVARAALEAGVRRLIHFSSIHAFDLRDKSRTVDEQHPRATGANHYAYDRSKNSGEQALREVMAEGLEAVIMHPTGVIGPHDYEPSRMGRVFLQLYHRGLPSLIEGGFDWIDVRDLVASAMAAETRGEPGDNYILSGHYTTVTEIADVAQGVTGVKRPKLSTPQFVARMGSPFLDLFAKMADKDPLYTSESLGALRANAQIDHSKASAILGHSPRPLRESVEDIYADFDRRALLKPSLARN